jgi:primosomal protein N' (replication factor Y) (superfamily II helicase)
VAIRAVSVLTEVSALDRPFTYVTTAATQHVAPGDRVRVSLQGRSLRGWILGDAEEIEDMLPLAKSLGYGPPPEMLDVATWVSERWCAPLARVLVSLTPSVVVRVLPQAPVPLAPAFSPRRDWRPGPIHLSPTSDPLDVVLAAYARVWSRPGSLLVLVPSEGWARRLQGRLAQRGLAVAGGEQWAEMRAGWPVIVASRGGALAPTPRLSGAVLIDADDESYVSPMFPNWDALSVVRERCRRDGADLWATSLAPSPSLLALGDLESDPDFVGGWPTLRIIDRRTRDPHEGVLSEPALVAAHRALEGTEAVALVVILQRLGTGRLLACARCGALARCLQCDQAEGEVDGGVACADVHDVREPYCRECGGTKLKRVRSGVTTLARDVAALLGQPVSEVTRAHSPDHLERVVVGTEAVFSRVRRCGVVVYVDFDQYLLAPRASARRAAIAAVGRAGRLVGSRREARGEVVIQTRRGEDLVLSALESLDFSDVIAADDADARALGLAPYGATAEISGEGAGDVVEGLVDAGVRVTASAQGFVVRGDDPLRLGRLLKARPRSSHVRVSIY